MSLYPGLTAVVAAHPARLANGLLVRALASICRQTVQPTAILVVNDTDKLGAGHTRQRILEQINTEWFAWLDSDDYWFPHHLDELVKAQRATGAKYVYSWFQANHDPLGHFQKTFNVCAPHHTTITALVNTEIAKKIGYPPSNTEGQFSDEDWSFISRFAEYCCEHGEKMVHVPMRTWYWEQSGQNTSGRPDRGDAV